LLSLIKDHQVGLTEAFWLADESDAGDLVAVGGEREDYPRLAAGHPHGPGASIDQRCPGAMGTAGEGRNL
jgi:hypothetical protein